MHVNDSELNVKNIFHICHILIQRDVYVYSTCMTHLFDLYSVVFFEITFQDKVLLKRLPNLICEYFVSYCFM